MTGPIDRSSYAHLLSPLALAMAATASDPRPYTYAAHLDLLSQKLVKLRMREPGTARSLLVTMPPRHGKSELCSHWFPAWAIAVEPADKVILTSYEAEFAASWGRKVRRSVHDHYPILGARIMEDSRAAHRWETGDGGGMTTAGVGGPITGRGAPILICDDPIKNAEEANSKVLRDSLWEWWTTTFLTRMEPDHHGNEPIVILILCMAGDTPVLRPDGTETPLRDIRPGDVIATYEAGRIISATVKNWANQGPDNVFAIRTKSGRVVRANARHPFLAIRRDGGLEWRRTDTLRRGDRILRVTEESGTESPAPPMDVEHPSAAEGSASRTTAKTAGPEGTDRPPATLNHDERFDSGAATGSPSRRTTEPLRTRTAGAPSAEGDPTRSTGPSTGPKSSASTTTTIRDPSGDSSATTATSSSGERARNPSYAPPLNTWSVGPDEIVEVAEAGTEDVFDIEVEGTHNFIANGYVASNTRWHEDDLAGRLMALPEFKLWEHLDLPAFSRGADIDALGRPEGTALWPEKFDAVALESRRSRIGVRAFTSLYQQSPTPPEGAAIHRAWWRWYEEKDRPKLEEFDQVIQSWDTTFGATASSDYVAGGLIGRIHNRFYVLDCVHQRLNGPDTLKAIYQMDEQYPIAKWAVIEDSASGSMILDILERERGHVTRGKTKGRSKEVRLHWGVNSVAAIIERGQVFLPKDCHWATKIVDEAASFPNAAHDDLVDMLVQGIEHLMPRAWLAEGIAERDARNIEPANLWEAMSHMLHGKVQAKLKALKDRKRHSAGLQFPGV